MNCCLVTVIASWVLLNYLTSAADPALSATPLMSTLYELEQSQKNLADLTCTDLDPGDVTVVDLTSVTPSSPCGKCFAVYPASECGPGVKFCLKYLPGKDTLDYHTASKYDIVLTCSDGTTADSVTVNVLLTVNTPPRFNPNQFVASHAVNNTKSKKAKFVVYDVNAVDDDNDNIIYSMTSVPTSSFFEIDQGNGEIKAKYDLDGACLSAITFYVIINDTHNDVVGPLAVHVTLGGSNVAPDITNLDLGIQVPEDTAVGSVISTIAITDESPNSVTYSLYASPPANLAFFHIDGDDIKVKSALNFEGGIKQHTNLTVRVTDTGGCTSSLHYLYVTVTDVNEKPDLRPSYAVYSVYEGSDFGTPPLTIPWNVVDPDNVDQHTYTIVDGNSVNNDVAFAISSSSGQLSLTKDYDIDNGNMPTSHTLTIQVTDKWGLTDNATVVLQFKDRNDHRPEISATTSSFSVCATKNSPGSVLGMLTCTDEDSAFQGNNDTYFTGSSTGITVLATGGIVMSSLPAVGQTYTAKAYCNDNGLFPGPLQSQGPVYISVTGTVCTTTTPPPTPAPATTTTTTTTTTTPAPTTTTTAATTAFVMTGNAKSWIEENLPWIIVAALLATALLGLLLYMAYIYLWGYCKRKCCTRPPYKPQRAKTPPRQITPVEDPSPSPPPPAVTQDPLFFAFWQQRFKDDFHGKQPSRTSNPRPVTPPGGKDSPPPVESTVKPRKSCCPCVIL